jgi:hypothetical protein
MSIMIATMVKDAGIWLPRFINQVEHLQGDISRVVCIYGTSQDNTYALLKHWQKTSHNKVEVYAEPYLPEEERQSYTLARLKRDIQNLLKDGDEQYYLKLDCDLVQLPKTLIPDLKHRNKDLIAPMVWIEGRKHKTFFDTYMFRLQGCMFDPLDPPGVDRKEPFTVDSVSCCTLATRKAALAGIYTNPYSCLPFCKSLWEKGFEVWVDPAESVYHIDLEALGLAHLPIHHPYSYVPYINSHGEKFKREQAQAQQFHQRRIEYEETIKQLKPVEADQVQKWLSTRPLITASYKVFNEASFLPYSLRSIYPHVDCIDIVEGATKYSLRYGDEFGASVDGTVEILKKFPDPEHKIRVMQGRWVDREQAQAKLLEMCASKWMLYIDGDEIIDAKSMRNLRQWCMKHQDGKIVYARPARFYNFWHDFKHIAYSLDPLSPLAEYGLPHAFLVWRDIPGLNFAHYHTEPVDGFGIIINIDHPNYRKKQAVLDDVFVYHFGNAKGAKALSYKLSQPDLRMLGDAKEDPWFSGLMPESMVLEVFKGKLPKILQGHPDYQNTRIRITEKKPLYKFELLQ